MNIIVDAQFLRRLAQQLKAAGHDAIYILDLARANRTSDQQICDLAAKKIEWY